MSENTALVKVDSAKYPMLAPEAQIAELIAENLGGGDISAFDLESVKIPAGGGTQWAIEGLGGDESHPAITGVIVSYQDCRAYWQDEFSGDNPPDCSSEDGKVGTGDPGGNCANCPFSKFGSAAKGNGQACKQVRRLFIVREGSYLPVVVSLPPTSIKACKHYIMRVTNAGLPYWGVVTRLGLERDKSSDGIPYSKVTFAVDAKDGVIAQLSPEQAAKVKDYATAFRSALATASRESAGGCVVQ